MHQLPTDPFEIAYRKKLFARGRSLKADFRPLSFPFSVQFKILFDGEVEPALVQKFVGFLDGDPFVTVDPMAAPSFGTAWSGTLLAPALPPKTDYYGRPIPWVFRLRIQGINTENTTKIRFRIDVGGKLHSIYETEIFRAVDYEAANHGNVALIADYDADGEFKVWTAAHYNRIHYWDPVRHLYLRDDELPKNDIIGDRFIGVGDEVDEWREGMEGLRRLGANLLLIPSHPILSRLYKEIGGEWWGWGDYVPEDGIFPWEHVSYATPPTEDDILARWKSRADRYKKAGFDLSKCLIWKRADEPSWYFPTILEQIKNSPMWLGSFRRFLQDEGLTSADLDEIPLSDIEPTGASGDLKLYFWTLRFIQYAQEFNFARDRRIAQHVFGQQLITFANWNNFKLREIARGSFGHQPKPDHPDVATGAPHWRGTCQAEAVSLPFTASWWNDGMTWMASMFGRIMQACSINGDSGGYVVCGASGTNPHGLEKTFISWRAHGCCVWLRYIFGPRHAFADAYSEDLEMFAPQLIKSARMIAASERIMNASASANPEVAILWPRSAQYLDPNVTTERNLGIVPVTSSYPGHNEMSWNMETCYLGLPLMHASIPHTYLFEDDIANGIDLSNFKVIYCAAPELPEVVWEKLFDWIGRGGRLVLICTSDVNDALFAHKRQFVGSIDAAPWIGKVSGPSGDVDWFVGKCKILEDLKKMAGAEVWAIWGDGSAAAMDIPFKKGMTTWFTGFPACSYWRSASWDPRFLPTNFSKTLREWILRPVRAASIEPTAIVSVGDAVEAIVHESETGIAINLINNFNASFDRLSVFIEVPFPIRRASLASGNKVSFERVVIRNAKIEFILPLNGADILLIEREDKLMPEPTKTILELTVEEVALLRSIAARLEMPSPPPPPPADQLYNISGYIVENGIGLPGVQISARGQKAPQLFHHVNTGNSAIYELMLPADTYEVRAEKDGYTMTGPYTITVPPDQINWNFAATATLE